MHFLMCIPRMLPLGVWLGSEDLFGERKKVIKLIKMYRFTSSYGFTWLKRVMCLLLLANRVSCMSFGGFLGFKLTLDFE